MNTAAADTSITPATHAVRRQRNPAGISELIRGIEAIPDGADRRDRSAAVAVAELAAQIPDVHVDDVGAGVVVVAPDRAQDLLAGEDVTAVSHQVREQLKLGRREAYELTVTPTLAAQQVDFHPTAGELRLRHLRGHSELCPDPGGELAERKRLAQVGGGTGIEGGK